MDWVGTFSVADPDPDSAEAAGCANHSRLSIPRPMWEPNQVWARRHDSAVAADLRPRLDWLTRNLDVTDGNLDGHIRRMWGDWTPGPRTVQYVDGGAGEQADQAWWFTHPEHGYGYTYLPQAQQWWQRNQRQALLWAWSMTASGTDLLTIALRLGAARPFQTPHAKAINHLLDHPHPDLRVDRGDALRVMFALGAPPRVAQAVAREATHASIA